MAWEDLSSPATRSVFIYLTAGTAVVSTVGGRPAKPPPSSPCGATFPRVL